MDINNKITNKNEKYNNIEIGLFSFKGRTGRLEFLKIYFTLVLFEFAYFFYIVPTAKKEYMITVFIIYCLISLAFLPMTVRRLHDSNLNGMYYLISLIPSLCNFINTEASSFITFISALFGVYSLYLMFRKGNSNTNNYGVPNPPKKYRDQTINIICVILFILIIVSIILSNS